MYVWLNTGLGQYQKKLSRVQVAPREPHKLTEPALKALRRLYGRTRSKHVAYIQQIRKNRDTYNTILTAIREGMPLKQTALLVAIDMVLSSPWRRTKEDRVAMAHLVKMYAANKVMFGKVPHDHHAITVPANESNTRNGKGSPSTITLSEAHLLNTPEGLAAVLAHEALHAYRYARGNAKPSLLDSETDTAMVGARVWASLGKDKYRSPNPIISEIDEESKQLDPANPNDDSKMRLHIAVKYSSGFAKSGDPRDLEEGAAMIDDLLKGSNERAARILKKASDLEVKRMFSAYADFTNHFKKRITPTNRRNWNLLFQEMDSRRLWKQ